MFGLYRDNNAKCIHKKITFGFGINEADQKRKTKQNYQPLILQITAKQLYAVR